MTRFTAIRCTGAGRIPALRFLYADISGDERDRQIEQVLAAADAGALNLDGLILCNDANGAVGAMLCVESAGRTMILWPPRVDARFSGADSESISEALMTKMREYACSRNARLAQSLLGEADKAQEPLLLKNGFFRITRLIYLRVALAGLAPPPAPRTDIEYVTYSAERHQQFLSSLERSYEASLDCPELTGVRAMEDIYASHRSQGVFDPAHWFLAMKDGRVVGCLLLAGLPDYKAVEVAYVSVMPDARGQGIGRELVRKAIRVGLEMKVDLVTLAVDIRNAPARKMYQVEGFLPWDVRDAFLLILDPVDGKFDRTLPAA